LFNFSANHVTVVSSFKYPKCIVYVVKDLDTNRCYKVYDYSKSSSMIPGSVYCISGKVNAANMLYLILEHHKIDKNYQQSSNLVVNVRQS
jgi:hypothetical protein